MKRPSPYSCLNSLPPLKKAISYFDTVRVFIPFHLSKSQQETLKSLDRSMHYMAMEKIGRKGVSCNFRARAYRYVAALTFQRLSQELVQLVQGMFRGGPPPLVSKAHIALDLTAATKCDAELVQEIIELGFLKRGHRIDHSINKYRNTRYYGHRGDRNVVAIYSDKPCRIGGDPCCHFEIRLQGRQALHEQGLTTLEDLLAFNPRAFWAKRLCLIELRNDALELIGEALYRRGPRRQIFRNRNETRQRWRINAGVFLRWVAAREGSYPYPTATALEATLRRFGLPPLRRFGKSVDVSGLLPMELTFKSVLSYQ